MNRSLYRRAAATGVAALLALFPPAAALAETAPAMPARESARPAVPAPGGGAPSLVPSLTKEQALALVQRYFPIPDGPGRLEATLENRGSRLIWQLMYRIDHDGGSTGYGVGEIDAHTGKVLRMSLSGPDLRPIRTGRVGEAYPEAYARAWAWALVREMYPAEAAALRPAPRGLIGFGYLPEQELADQYTFTWAQYHGDVPVAGSTVTVTMDKYTLEYVSLQASFPNLTFPSGGPTLIPAEALKLYRQNAVPRLVYQPMWDPYPYAKGPSAMKLVYRLEQRGVLDAVTGRSVDASGQELPGAAEPEPVPAGAGPVVKPPRLPLDNDSAMAYARELLALPEGAQLRLEPRFSEGENFLALFWYDQGESASVSLDLQTGLIRGANRGRAEAPRFGPGGPRPPAPLEAGPQAKAREAAIAVVQRYYSQVAGDLRLQPEPDRFYMSSQPDVSFFFQRYVNGIPASYDGVRVSIDPETLAWVNMSATWTDLEFPKPDGVIAPEKAAESFFAERQPLLVYQAKMEPARPSYGPYAEEDQRPREAMLVYQLTSDRPTSIYNMVDALTGQAVDWSGRPPATLDEMGKVLAGHWAEGELRFMLVRRGLAPERLNPDGALTRAEALQVLLTAEREVQRYGGGPDGQVPYADIKQGDALYTLVGEAIRQRLLRPEGERPVFGGDQPITRAEFAVWLVRALKLDGLARSGLVTGSTFQDLAGLTAEERNAAAFLQSLGIASGDNAFRGADKLTQAEGAAFAVRLIKYLRTAR